MGAFVTLCGWILREQMGLGRNRDRVARKPVRTRLFTSEVADLKAENTLDAIQSIKNGYQSKKTSSLPGTFPLQRRGFFLFSRSNRKLQHRGPGNYLMYQSAQTSKAEFFSSSRRQRRALRIAAEEKEEVVCYSD
jgi:hypothetical protein